MPRLFRGDKPTAAMLALRWCARPEGFVPPYLAWSNFRKGYWYSRCWYLCDDGLIEERRSGPRGGKRWHTTPLGNTVLSIIDTHPDPWAGLMLIDMNPRDLGVRRL